MKKTTSDSFKNMKERTRTGTALIGKLFSSKSNRALTQTERDEIKHRVNIINKRRKKSRRRNRKN